MNKALEICFGIDLGGTKIEIVALAEQGGELLRRRVPTPQGDYPATVSAVAGLVLQAERELRRRGRVGVGIPGSASALTGRIRNANSTCLNGQPLQRDLEAALGRKVRLANDANCFALSEAADGAAVGYEVVFAVILGTGVGGGIVVRGRLLHGANGIAGEWGHNYLPPLTTSSAGPAEGGGRADPLCYCGRRGCIETYLSGPGLTADHFAATGRMLMPQDIALCSVGDAACEATLQRFESRLARALAQVINLLDPDVIVLGGGLSNIDRLYDKVPRLLGEHVFSDRIVTRLLRNRHGDSSGVRGAARLWQAAA